MRYFLIVCLALFFSQANGQTILETSEPLIEIISDYDYIPGEANYDLIADRLSCIENEIPLHLNEKVYAFINYFAVKDREYTRLMLKRKNLYFPIFEKYLKKHGLPDELKYLAIIESGLNPKAVSHARAVGLWQFMPLTGRSFKLHQDWYIDERIDFEASTEAACLYLKQLYGMFGDWELAIAAYNTGPGNVRKAIRRSGYKKTFWEIYPLLHRETRSYLPQFTAMTYVLNYADEHNLFEEQLEYLPVYDTIRVNDFVNLETLAAQLNICLEDIQKLNPALMRNAVPANVNDFVLRIPYKTKEVLNNNRVAILDSASRTGREELAHMARNTIGSTYGRDKIVHRVRSGDVLGTIAGKYGVRIADIKKWNNLRSNLIRVGQPLSIWLNSNSYGNSTAGNKRYPVSIPDSKIYTVQPGDTLWDISRKYEGLTIEKIKELNNMNTSNIKPGQKLKLG
ncbi:MAG: LysM peptidoglycan-binding domain-containing protein [Candidatus Cyclobacteriaceae bacterium M2_1C_046]